VISCTLITVDDSCCCLLLYRRANQLDELNVESATGRLEVLFSFVHIFSVRSAEYDAFNTQFKFYVVGFLIKQ